MNELFDYGRPRSISLVVLADRGGRQLPDRRAARRRAGGGAAGKRLRLKRAAERQAVAGAGRCLVVSSQPATQRQGRTAAPAVDRGLPREILTQILDTAEPFAGVTEREVKKVPLMRGKSVFNLFFEASTRTRTTFEIAAKRLSADVINLNVAVSSQSKASRCSTRWRNLSAMQADVFVCATFRGAPYLIARHVKPHEHVINAGDGRHAHPTQGCSISTPSATTRRISPGSRWRSWATCCIHASRAR
jgi:hypothetical protein